MEFKIFGRFEFRPTAGWCGLIERAPTAVHGFKANNTNSVPEKLYLVPYRSLFSYSLVF
jgi:hypothetical protein